MDWRRWACALVIVLAPAAAGAQPYAFVSNAAAQSVSVIDVGSDTLVGSFPLSGMPTAAALSPDGSRLLVARTELGSVAMIDTASGAVSSLAVGTAPVALAMAPLGRVYVANAGADTLSVVNWTTGAVVRTIAVGDAPADVVAAGWRVYVANWGDGTVSVVDARTAKVVATVRVGTFPAGLAVHRGRLYVANFADDTVSVIDTRTLAVTATVPVARRPRGMALDRSGTRLFVASFEQSVIDVIDTATGAVVQSAPSGALNPVDLMMGPDGTRLYVAHLAAGQPLRVLDAATLAPLHAITAPSGPVALAGFVTQEPAIATARTENAVEGLTVMPAAERADPRPRSPEGSGIFDGEFNPADWTLFSSTGSSSTTQETAGGNPGAWRKTVHTSSGQPVETWHEYTALGYDPSLQGPIASIDVSWDRRVDGEAPVNDAVAVFQNGVAYRTATQTFTANAWRHVDYPQLTAASFVGANGQHPDFSSLGSPLLFGYYRSTPATATVSHGIDNFTVGVLTAPTAGVIGFEDTLLVLSGANAIVNVERRAGTQGAVGATVNVVHPNGNVTTHAVSWPDGNGDPFPVTVPIQMAGNGSQTARAHLGNVAGGASLSPHRSVLIIAVPAPGWPPELLDLYLSVQVVLAAFSPLWIAALSAPALFVGLRRRRRARLHPPRLRRLLAIAFAATALAALGGCVPTAEIEYAPLGFNQKLRPDRRPLEAAQVQTDPSTLAFGPYRVGPTELASAISPVDANGNAGRIRQADCWWMAQGPSGGGDAVKARWEAVVDLGGAISEYWYDPDDDRLEVGTCRMDDPETRNPPQSRDGNDPSLELDCSVWGDQVAFSLNHNASLPRCTADAVLMGARLEAYGTTLADVHQRCSELRTGFTRLDRVIGKGTDFFDGAASAPAGTDTRVASCTAADGNLLIPPAPTRYRLWLGDHVTQWLDPVLLPVQRGAVLGRRMASDTADWIWLTPETYEPRSLDRRWQENFSPSIVVVTAALFEPTGPNGKTYVNPIPPPALCLEDRDSGAGCAWTCDDANAADGKLSYDLLAPGKCRDRAGQVSAPAVTPTSVPFNLRQTTQRLPLIWRVNRSALPQADLWIEFTLQTTLTPAALTAAPPLVDLGGTRVGEHMRGAFTVRNSGEHPMRITAVAMDPASGSGPNPGDFVPRVPYAPEPVPLPVDFVALDPRTTVVKVRPEAEQEVLHTLYEDSVLARLAPRRHGFSTAIDGTVVTEQDGILVRDNVNARFNHDLKRQPAVRMTYAYRSVPFVVQPGESFEVSVRGTPSATNERRGYVKVSAESVLDPTQRVTVRVLARLFGMQGPLLSALPGSVNLYVDQGAGQARTRTVLVQNAGDIAGTLGTPVLRGPGNTGLPANSPFRLDDPYASWGSLGVGEYREVRVQFTSACGTTIPGWRDDAAEVRWTTADGPIVVPVRSTTYCPH